MRIEGLMICGAAVLCTACPVTPDDVGADRNVNGTPDAGCGNGRIDPGEACDGSELGGKSCLDFAFTGGELQCTGCALDTRACVGCGDGVCGEDETPGGCPADCGARTVTVGSSHSCVGLKNGTAWCWGDNYRGKLGTGDTLDTSLITNPVVGLSNVSQLSAGVEHTCAVLADGTARCWGYGGAGELGDGETTTSSNVPVTVRYLTAAKELACGFGHTCAVREDGNVLCWGYNGSGQLGNGNYPTNSDAPVGVSDITDASAVAAGQNHSCAVRLDGTVWCWGDNEHGQLGSETLEYSDVPVQVAGLDDVVRLGSGANSLATCAVRADGTVWCWGDNYLGNLGDGTNGNVRYAPVQVQGLSGAARVATALTHTCATTAEGGVFCWGVIRDGEMVEYAGQLGHYADDGSDTPVPVHQMQQVVDVAAGGRRSCAVKADGTLWCWGDNRAGFLGTGLPFQIALYRLPVDLP
jgi:alpha-tubulin suppressor-like RCC1 family protein